MESHASAASSGEVTTARRGAAAAVRRLRWDAGLAICVTLAGSLAAIAFIGNGGLQLGSSTLVEIAVILAVGLLVAAAVVFAATDTPLYGGASLAAVAGLVAVTALSILWSLHPADSWIETNRTLAYLAAFAGGIAAVRLFPRRWDAVLYGVLIALAIVCLYGLATKVAPGWLAEDEIYARLREPYGYWNAVGVTAAMGIPICLWLGTREASPRAKALAYPLLGILLVTMLLSFSRGSIMAAAVGVALWLALVPRRLSTLAVLLPSVAAAALVTAWAFGQSALTDDRVALAEREDSGIVFGVILVAMAALLFAAGLAIERRRRTHPMSEGTRRTVGKLALGSLAAIPLVVLAGLAFSERGIGGTVSDRWDELTHEQKTPQNDPGRLIETGNVRTIYWARAMDVWREHEVAGAGAGAFAQSQLRFRNEPTQGRHAHGYIHQTLADLGPDRARGEPCSRSWAGSSPPARRSDCRAAVSRRRGAPSAPGCSRSRWWRSSSVFTPRSTGPGSCPQLRSPGCSAPAGSRAAGRCRRPDRSAADAGGRGRTTDPRPDPRTAGSACAGDPRARRRVLRSRSRSRGVQTGRATRRWLCSTRATSRARARLSPVRATSTRCRPSRTSSSPQSRMPPATAALALKRAPGRRAAGAREPRGVAAPR